ncbi:GATA transcription factor 20 [Acorus calamus]|uniref:GATA transcription factor 20 n=1 Tax=Acorus calamus TaxID=4465 RepID=A0AAV9DRL5_ACOCL|nr:GATA transcription factor 20 [Acorus calamus]
MMQRCSSNNNNCAYHGNSIFPCSCSGGLFHNIISSSSSSSSSSGGEHSFSFLFPADPDNHHQVVTDNPSSLAVVDCTLSLGTPSTRRCGESSSSSVNSSKSNHHRRSSAVSSSTSHCWGFFSHSKQPSSATPATNISAGGTDALLARRCANCDTTSTPLWRNGPRGPKSLCNACGIRYKKEERRAAAAATAASAVEMGQQHSWTYPPPHPHGEFRLISRGGEDPPLITPHQPTAASVPFISWSLNVPPPATI